MIEERGQPSALLESGGWEAGVDLTLLPISDGWDKSLEFRSYGHVLRRFFEELVIDAVLCVAARPAASLKDSQACASKNVEK